MRIQKITSRSRRDFTAIYLCEYCGYEEESYGYDDSNFHNNVVPNMNCKSCGKSTNDEYKNVVPRTPKYPDDLVL